MIELVGCILLSIIGITFIVMLIDELRTNYEVRKQHKEIIECKNENLLLRGKDIENFSDGYHTFNELYEFRKLYNALLFKEWEKNGKYEVYKSKRHYNGELCFGGGWFIVVAILPTGQISNHYEMKDWDLFDIPEYEKSKYEFDGHTSQDVLKRLEGII